MKKINVVIPCFNEIENVEPMSEQLTLLFEEKLSNYDIEILFIDNDSSDGTRDVIRGICSKNRKVKAIFNARNYGQFNSPYYALLQTKADCAILLCCDFQDPIDLIPQMIEEWENGNKIIVMQKIVSEENKAIFKLRSLYYKFLKRFSDVEQIEHFTGFGLYDKTFIDVLRDLKDPIPFLRGIVAELGFKIKIIPYKQAVRKAGATHNNFYTLYDAAMLGFTSYTKIGLRMATFIGFGVSLVSTIIAIVYLILKLIMWNEFVAGTAPILLGMLFLGSAILLFLGLMGEYLLTMNARIMNRPLVIEEERINFD